MQPAPSTVEFRLDLYAVPAVLVSFLMLGFFVAAKTADPLMALQAWTFMAGVGIALVWLVQHYKDGIPEDDRSAMPTT